MFSLPLKTEAHPHGIYSEHELYQVLAVIFICIFFDLDPAKSFALRLAAKAVTQQLGKLIEANVKAVSLTGWIAGIVDGFAQTHTPLKDYGVHMVRRLLDSGLGVKEITWSQILPTAGAMVANQGQVVSTSFYPSLFLFLLIRYSSPNCSTTTSRTKVRFTYPRYAV